MRYKLVVLGMAAAAFLGPSSSLLAAPLPCPATATDLGTYLAPNFSCTVNDKTISGMAASAPIGLAINVTPVTDTNNPGLEFTTSLNSGSFPISYTIAAPSTDPITGASLAITGMGNLTAPFSNTETLSNGLSLSTSNTTVLSASTPTFSAVTSLNVENELGSAEGGILTSVTNQFSETPLTTAPEPSSLTLLGVGLSAFALARRRSLSAKGTKES